MVNNAISAIKNTTDSVNSRRSFEVKKFIDDRQQMFWYSPAPKSETVSGELLVEVVLNY